MICCNSSDVNVVSLERVKIIFSYSSWPRVTETLGSKAVDKGKWLHFHPVLHTDCMEEVKEDSGHVETEAEG